MKAHTSAVARALLVTFLWSTSWLLIRVGLEEIPPLTFAALRYSIAVLVLWGVTLFTGRIPEVKKLPKNYLPGLILLGIVFYTITQASQFIALNHLEASTLSLLLSFSTILAATIARTLLNEKTRLQQWLGVIAYVISALVFLQTRLGDGNGNWIGYSSAAVGVISNVAAGILGRAINKTKRISSLLVTLISMSAGSLVLLVIALFIDGVPHLGYRELGILGWLAVINTAFAFVMWNRAQQDLQAVETSVINSTMLFQISILAVLFLGEDLSSMQWSMIIIGGIGTLLVQLPTRKIKIPLQRK